MPYVKQSKRAALLPIINRIKHLIDKGDLENAGDMNYIITVMVNHFLQRKGRNYATCNEIMGFFSCAEKEFYRRTISILEDEKIIENGDV